MIAMPQTTVTSDRDAVISETQIAAPPERIFQALTDSDLLMRWWNGEDGPCRVKRWELEPRLGGRLRILVDDPTGTVLPNGHSVTIGEIVEFDPPRTLAYTWRATFHSNPDHDTLVRWELTPTGRDTLVKMTHSRLKPLPEGASYSGGWPGVIALLKKFAEAGEVPLHAN